MNAPRHGERGQTIVEFTLASTVIILFLFGTLEFGRALFDYHLVANAARIGTRYAIVNATTCDSACVQTYVRARSPGLDTTQLAVTLNLPCQRWGCQATVTASYVFSFVGLARSSITMTSTSRMSVSQ